MKLKKSIDVLVDNGKEKIFPGKQNFGVFSCMYYKKSKKLVQTPNFGAH